MLTMIARGWGLTAAFFCLLLLRSVPAKMLHCLRSTTVDSDPPNHTGGGDVVCFVGTGSHDRSCLRRCGDGEGRFAFAQVHPTKLQVSWCDQ
jgi:hypothetical protein